MPQIVHFLQLIRFLRRIHQMLDKPVITERKADPLQFIFRQLIKAVLFTYAPEAIIIGGGIASAFPLFEASMLTALESFPYPENVAATRIAPSTLPNAAMLGAGLLV